MSHGEHRVYLRSIWSVLEGTFELILANAHEVKAVPGRKTDVKDCAWLADLLAHGLVRASFAPSGPIRELRELTRYRYVLVRERVVEVNRVHKLLESANIKLAPVITDILGVSGRASGEPGAVHPAAAVRSGPSARQPALILIVLLVAVAALLVPVYLSCLGWDQEISPGSA